MRKGAAYDSWKDTAQSAPLRAARPSKPADDPRLSDDPHKWYRGYRLRRFTCWICRRARCLDGMPYGRHSVCVYCYRSMHRNHVRYDPNCLGCRYENRHNPVA